MPELPEVETTRRGLERPLRGRHVVRVIVREPRLRWRVPRTLARELAGTRIEAVERRAKYLLLRTNVGTAILHLGMSGSLRVIPATTPAAKHDHVDLVLDNGQCLRLRDPRRFGALLWTRDDPMQHALLRHLGPEPLGRGFHADHLWAATRRRRVAMRDLLLNSRIVSGIGNIYANEALFLAGVRPTRPAGRLTRTECERLVKSIRRILERAIRAGGTTLRDFSNADGLPGYFQQTLQVYGRTGELCRRCGNSIKTARLGNRSAFYCPKCQS
ncbi:MAG: DNA-formamidopyrimidine glycosylase [Candidatus Muproteobacteria bacterium RBG_16_62_13]|uniref:Formamidopyrimidine-DNA glycosylase n=1 Tax=Candidatus Muproteobacteria bacterium RBG_16_62_13 TaxID=1817756 RepID=A0A1F6T7W0_9PROT|nr:MAG: DNA-formamidopyrimidine glycosylase [Candidatus Muproteobacteria bacterium RBG_16_62_13]